MSLHPDADALIAAFLDRPADETPRLVLADWLDDTGRPADAAWAAYIRARSAAARHEDGSRERNAALREAATHAVGITARLTVPAARFVVHPPAFLDLLTADRLAVSLDGWVPLAEMRELVPESVARSDCVFSLSSWREPTVYILSPNPDSADLHEKLEFILNRRVIILRAERDALDAFLAAQYPGEWEHVDSPTLYPYRE